MTEATYSTVTTSVSEMHKCSFMLDEQMLEALLVNESESHVEMPFHVDEDVIITDSSSQTSIISMGIQVDRAEKIMKEINSEMASAELDRGVGGMAGSGPIPIFFISPSGAIVETGVPPSTTVENANIPPALHMEDVLVHVSSEEAITVIHAAEGKSAKASWASKGSKRGPEGGTSGPMPKKSRKDKKSKA